MAAVLPVSHYARKLSCLQAAKMMTIDQHSVGQFERCA